MEDRFTWTQEYKKSWEEDVKEAPCAAVSSARAHSHTRKSIIRQFHIVIDTSASIEKTDYLPTIRSQITLLIPPFLDYFVAMNPLSTLSFMTCGSTFKKYSKDFDVSGMFNTIGDGRFSFLNCLQAMVDVLKQSNYTRECLLITASLGTNDAGDYNEVCKNLRKHSIKVSIISICGEITVFKKICELTNGVFCVPADVNHFEILLAEFAKPLESTEATSTLVKFGFPQAVEVAGFCCCHLSFHNIFYECPSCGACVCSVPTNCPICDLRLVSPLSISKSYHHMYPMKPLEASTGDCRVCGGIGVSGCPDCRSIFCKTCHSAISDDLSFCIYCKQHPS